jgi:hypothetical protein
MKNVSKYLVDNPQGHRYRDISMDWRITSRKILKKWVRGMIGGFTGVRIRASGMLT